MTRQPAGYSVRRRVTGPWRFGQSRATPTTRTAFEELPADVLAAVEGHMGRNHRAEAVSGGLNSEIAARLHTDAGACHVTGLRSDHPRAWTQRREAEVNSYLAGISPELLWRIEESGWDLLGFEPGTDPGTEPVAEFAAEEPPGHATAPPCRRHTRASPRSAGGGMHMPSGTGPKGTGMLSIRSPRIRTVLSGPSACACPWASGPSGPACCSSGRRGRAGGRWWP